MRLGSVAGRVYFVNKRHKDADYFQSGGNSDYHRIGTASAYDGSADHAADCRRGVSLLLAARSINDPTFRNS
ncbi:MAG: hypothetical protein M1296_06815 [Chloroflexi bacterium]|nr:hypothetical protein [Chloroflexota bacterium]